VIKKIAFIVSNNNTEQERYYFEMKTQLEDHKKQKLSKLPDYEKCMQQRQALEKLLESFKSKQRDLVNENKRITEKENERRHAIAKKVQDHIGTIKDEMDKQAHTRLLQSTENEAIRLQFRGLVDQYEGREKDLVEQQKKREQEVLDLEKEIKEQEMISQIELIRSQRFTETNKTLKEGEEQLRKQLKEYGEKLGLFKKTLKNSQNVFQNYKHELNKMKEAKKRLEKEREKNKIKKNEIERLESQKSELEDMCRALREEK